MDRTIYYKEVIRRISPLLLILPLFFVAGCDRGSTPALVGKAAPEFVVQDGANKVDLRDLHGQVVVLNFWATWCPPCVEEMPALGAMQQKMGDKVKVVAISLDADPRAYEDFLREHKIDFFTIRDPKQESNAIYGTFKFPETYIIDRNGILRRKFIGPVDWTAPDILDYLNKL